jgi:hypothetical protein
MKRNSIRYTLLMGVAVTVSIAVLWATGYGRHRQVPVSANPVVPVAETAPIATVAAVTPTRKPLVVDAEAEKDARLALAAVANTKDRSSRLDGETALYKRFTDSKRFHDAVGMLVRDGEPKLPEYERFLAACLVAGIGHPSRLGPNSLDHTPLGTYVNIQNGMRPSYAPDERRLAADESVQDLEVTVPPIDSKDQTVQEILWRVMQDYNLTFEVRDTSLLYIMKKQAK